MTTVQTCQDPRFGWMNVYAFDTIRTREKFTLGQKRHMNQMSIMYEGEYANHRQGQRVYLNIESHALIDMEERIKGAEVSIDEVTKGAYNWQRVVIKMVKPPPLLMKMGCQLD